jgi:hypothetical protein
LCRLQCLSPLFQPDEIAHQEGSDPEEDDLLSDEDDNSKEKDRPNPDFEMGEADPEKELGDPAAGQPRPPSQQPRNLNPKQASLFRDALDLACDRLFDEISIKVIIKHVDETYRKSYTLLLFTRRSTAKVLPSSVFFTPSSESQVVATPHNFLQSEVDGVEIFGVPTSATTSSSDICSSLVSGPAAAGVLSALSAGDEVGAGGALSGGVDPKGTATCTLAASIHLASADDNATAPFSPMWGRPTGQRATPPALCWTPLTLLAATVPR